ncbi:sulfur carrier protein ThiS [Endozoicomonas numazuensis]|uniref:Thiamine biosynthesis protein ThiS n=1 Tax=Endozoicomonas numazuensis TaxID=1137799 RepID=A0A081NFQ4_9GAMM|nr:sulfur carrier protein ThiS [Endozoicomonas numazuensis]KEQ17277.1 thiamine biosynthesis protein ThiS [Endozoicomonas numazuensis]
MQFFVNDQPLSSDSTLTLSALLEKINQAEKGVALAVNRQIISRSQWPQTQVEEGDRITLIKATAGG